MPGRSYSAGSGYRFGFQNQEKDNELKGGNNCINFEYRSYDPRIGRFFSIDPLAAKYSHYTPYQFSGNKVIAWREFEGLEESKAGDAGTYLALRGSGYNHEQAQKVIDDMRVAEAQAASYFTVLFGGMAVIVAGGFIMEVGVGVFAEFILEEGVEYVFQEVTGIPVILNPVDVLEQMAKKGVRKFATDIIVDGRKFVAGTDITTIRKWAYNVKKFGKETAEYLSSGTFKFGKSRQITGEYSNLARKDVHLRKRLQQGYDFKSVEEMENYAKGFFGREGNNIIEYEQNGYIYRVDVSTQEFGVINPDGKVGTVFKVTPGENSSYSNAQEYLIEQINQ